MSLATFKKKTNATYKNHTVNNQKQLVLYSKVTCCDNKQNVFTGLHPHLPSMVMLEIEVILEKVIECLILLEMVLIIVVRILRIQSNQLDLLLER